MKTIMETIKEAAAQGLTINVEALKSQLLRQKIIQPRFRWDMTTEQAEAVLTAAYEAEVTFRHHKFIKDETTTFNIRKLAGYITEKDGKFGIMLCGVCGNGKTTLLLAFQNATNYLVNHGLLNDCKGYDGRKVGIRIIYAKDIQKHAKDDNMFNELRRTDMLAIEDMGREATEVLDYGNVLNPVIDLLEYRYTNQLFTFITTNLTGKEVREKYGNRIADRFNEMMDVIIFRNQTYRK